MRPYKMQIRTFLRDGVPTYQTVATKGKEVIPFWYNGDIIYFPSWAYHQVDPNCSDDLRVVIAGNITVTDCFDQNMTK